MVDRGWGKDDFSADDCSDLLDLISNAKLSLKELKSSRSSPFDVHGLQSRLRQSEQVSSHSHTM
jgi:hypothetical protein